MFCIPKVRSTHEQYFRSYRLLLGITTDFLMTDFWILCSAQIEWTKTLLGEALVTYSSQAGEVLGFEDDYVQAIKSGRGSDSSPASFTLIAAFLAYFGMGLRATLLSARRDYFKHRGQQNNPGESYGKKDVDVADLARLPQPELLRGQAGYTSFVT